MQTSWLNELIRETDQTVMLDASDYDAVEEVLPFMSAIVNKFCDSLTIADITKVFTKYVDLINFFFKGIKTHEELKKRYLYFKKESHHLMIFIIKY